MTTNYLIKLRVRILLMLVTKGNGGLVEQVTDGVDGFHVNTYDVKEFLKLSIKYN